MGESCDGVLEMRQWHRGILGVTQLDKAGGLEQPTAMPRASLFDHLIPITLSIF